MSEAYHIKYRPKTLDDFVGHKSLVKSLGNVLKSKNCPHAFLFSGPSGCGKTTLGRIIANHLECDLMDLIEIDAGADRGIENVRELIERASLRPLYGEVKVYIFDEAHGLTKPAQDALLKTLEDCPSHAYFVLCSTDPQKIIKTIKTRCAEYEVSRLGDDLIFNLLCDVCDAEDLDTSEEVLDVVVKHADGTPRNALVSLAMVKDFEDTGEAEEVIQRGLGEQSPGFIELARAVLRREKTTKILLLYKNLPERDPVKVRYGLANYMKSVLLGAKTSKDAQLAASLLQHFARLPVYEIAEAEFVLDLYLAVKQ